VHLPNFYNSTVARAALATLLFVLIAAGLLPAERFLPIAESLARLALLGA
jgi:hypothetical protein